VPNIGGDCNSINHEAGRRKRILAPLDGFVLMVEIVPFELGQSSQGAIINRNQT
jgi:hypothetical protein